MKPIFQFSNVVVVENNLIGCILKTWDRNGTHKYYYEVYVRDYNSIKEYEENEIQHFIYSKELTEDEEKFYT